MTTEQRRATDAARQRRHRAGLTLEQHQAIAKRKADARRERMATDPVWAEGVRAGYRERDAKRRAAKKAAKAAT